MAAKILFALWTSRMGLVAAQGESHTRFTPDLSKIDSNVLRSWCPGELAVCPEICGGGASTNECFTVSNDWIELMPMISSHHNSLDNRPRMNAKNRDRAF
jgi:hypothetical protein